MDYQPINELVEKYFQGASTRQEEAVLRGYFRQTEIDPSLETYRPLFAYLEEARAEKIAPGFEEKVLTEIGPSTSQKIRPLWSTLVKIAAAFLIVLATWWHFNPAPAPQTAAVDWSKYEPKTVAEAYEITRGALLRTSKELNQTAQRAAEEVSKVQKASKIFN